MKQGICWQGHLQHREHKADQSAKPPAELLPAEILATVSHELRSPLTAITGYTSTLLLHGYELTPEERQAFLLAIQEAGDHMKIVVDRLLHISQLEMGGITLHCAPLDLVSLAQEALMVAKERLEKRRTTSTPLPRFRFRLKDALTEDEAIIRADRALVREALDQLLENAIQYSPGGGQVNILLRSFHSTSPAGSLPAHMPLVEICVTDQGTGIPQEQLMAIFDRFTRSDTSLTRETSGLGLGLTICKSIAELHRGGIWAESTPGKGSTFHLVLPQDPADTRERLPMSR